MAVVAGYPGTSESEEIYTYYRSDSFTPPSRGEATITVPFDARPDPDVPFYYWFALLPADAEISSLESGDGEYLCETDRLRIRNGDLTRARHPDEPGDERTTRYTRHAAEGCYSLEFTGTSYDSNWSASFLVYKHGYIQDLNGESYDDRRYYVYEALEDGLADEFGRILNNEAEANGITGDRQKVEFLIDFVQNLPYIPDDVSTGYDDYTKRHIETVIDGGGDCEDSAIMLASLLLSDSFSYGTALLLLPGHAALGVKGGDDLPGYYYEKDGTKYYYVETTGKGWDVGGIPDEYRNEEAYVRVF
jgi:transglutaminase-like putative cysteine protease